MGKIMSAYLNRSGEWSVYTIDDLCEMESLSSGRELSVVLFKPVCYVPLHVFRYQTIVRMRLSRLDVSSYAAAMKIEETINKHLSKGRDLLLCQDELIDAGFAEWARL